MSSVALSVFAAVLVGATSAADPIDTWVAQLSADPMWENGTYPIIDLPKTATTEEVVAKVLRMTGLPGKGTGFEILKIKKVHIRAAFPISIPPCC